MFFVSKSFTTLIFEKSRKCIQILFQMYFSFLKIEAVRGAPDITTLQQHQHIGTMIPRLLPSTASCITGGERRGVSKEEGRGTRDGRRQRGKGG